MLTIGQLARYAGCTVKAVRVYHERGLLAEPRRDDAGYRRYDAQAVIDLARIVTLVRAGVPLSRIPTILTADDHAAEIARIDAELADRISQLTERRRRLAHLDDPDRLCLSPAVVAHLDRVRALGFSERYLLIERDSWVLGAAIAPATVERYLPSRVALMDDAEYVEISHAFDDALDWGPDDPRIESLARRTVAALDRLEGAFPEPDPALAPAAESLLNDFQGDAPAWVAIRRRVDGLLDGRA
ncbi:MerR family transcriptional regulator [Microbacterium sp. 18062]|uniref:MerR family transcriptional regulator n=1 Tax=Microbacterium sp. 18062 TaxID=2681410 RepID=UPI0013577A69|nr:MerR family transcriptional regulator [Microbacterium sp. 18062]